MEKTYLFNEYFLIRLLINTFSMILLIRVIYYSIYRKRDFFFTFFLINFVVFLLSFMLDKTSAFSSIGAAFGLLAAFSLLRFRTETISIKDMTYLFIIMTLGLVNAVMMGANWEIIVLNVLIIVVVFLVDGNQLMKNQQTKTIEYEGLENIKPENHSKLIKELSEKTGLRIQRISIEHIDMIKSRSLIRLYYY